MSVESMSQELAREFLRDPNLPPPDAKGREMTSKQLSVIKQIRNSYDEGWCPNWETLHGWLVRDAQLSTGILTPVAAKQLGAPEAANKRVVFEKRDFEGNEFADEIYFNGKCLGDSIMLFDEGIIEG